MVADARTWIISLVLKTIGLGGGDPDVPSRKTMETESAATSCGTSKFERLILNVVGVGDVTMPVVGLTVAALISCGVPLIGIVNSARRTCVKVSKPRNDALKDKLSGRPLSIEK